MKNSCLACQSNQTLIKKIYSNNWRICKICGHSSLVEKDKEIIKVNYKSNNLATNKVKFRHKYLSRMLRNFSNKSILDIGAGNYLPLLISDEKLRFKKYTGIDMYFQSYVTRLAFLNQINENIIDALDGISEKYDFIILDNILEHLERPDIVIKKILPLIKDSTKVYVSVPNKFNIKNLGNYKREYSHFNEHVHVFTSRSLNNIFLLNGFKSLDFFSMIVNLSIYPQISLSFLNMPLFGLYKLYKLSK